MYKMLSKGIIILLIMKENNEIRLKKKTKHFTYQCQLCMNRSYDMKNWLISNLLFLVCPHPVSNAAMIEK